MTVDSELEQIREDLNTLKVLYKRLADDRIKKEKATPKDVEAIMTADTTVSRDEFFKVLDETPVKERRSSVRRSR